MAAPTFIRFGESSDLVFNTSQILWIEHLDIPVTEGNRRRYIPKEVDGDTAFCIHLQIRNHPGLNLACGPKAHRDHLFNELASMLNAKVLHSLPSYAAIELLPASITKESQDEVIKPTDDLT